MKKSILIIVLGLIISSCNNFSGVKKDDICGKSFRGSSSSPVDSHSITSERTTLNCDGTFESSSSSREEGGELLGYHSNSVGQYKGSWELVNDISDEIKNAVKKYGIKHTNYSIIKYSSNNGVTDYCVYYPNSYNGVPDLAPLNISCDPDHSGIYGGTP